MYHVHGFFQFEDKHIGVVGSEAPDIRVLTEQEFFDFFNSPTSTYNYTFLHTLREYRVLFIGMSLQDDNVRRLLHYSFQERRQSHIKEGRDDADATARATRHFALLPAPNAAVRPALETSLLRLGVRPVWLTDYDEIPDRLGALYESTPHEWSAVYP
jgi:hypothetical protein